ncbi:hypothetical protein [Deinococcus sp.]|uniref:hypothetical protein n=1 Tax=Deinococcus sp. TaxID=47478 RepID=UPI003CC64139
MKRWLLAIKILSTYTRIDLLTRQWKRSRGSRRAAMHAQIERASSKLARLQDLYAGPDDLASRRTHIN